MCDDGKSFREEPNGGNGNGGGGIGNVDVVT